MLTACGKKKGVVRVAGYEIDSVVVDTTASLVQSAGAPTCQLSLHLHYLKDAKAAAAAAAAAAEAEEEAPAEEEATATEE